MADYLVVTRTQSSNNDGFYLDGVTAYSRQEIGVWKVAYKADMSHTIRMGCYRSGVSTFDFVFVSETALYGLDIRLVSPTAQTVRSTQSIWTEIGQGYSGYYNHFALQIDDPIINYTVFTSLTNCIHALAFSSSPPSPPTPPSENSIVVTVNATGYDQSAQDITVEATAYIDGADFIIVEATAGMPDDDPSFDPNSQGGYSGPGGGTGTFDDTSDEIPIPPLPPISASGCGLITLFRPTFTELQELGNYLWTNLRDFIENLNKLFMNPMDYIISLNIFPCIPDVSSPREINIGSVTTSITMSPVTSQWFELNCGSVTISEYWGSALDYAPNTRISLFLPFIGSVALNTDEVMGKRISLLYRIDLLSGQCVAMVTVHSDADAVYYQYTGECAVSVPLTGADWSRIYSAAIGAIGAAVTGGIAAGAAGAAAGGATAALVTKDAAQTAISAGNAYADINATSRGISGVQQMRQNMMQASQMALDAGRQAASAPARVANGIRSMRIANTVNNTVQQTMGGKGYVTHSGTVSGNAGMLGVKKPYVLIEYPNQSMADNYKHFVGYPSNIYARLGDLTGYTECEQIIANSLANQTDSELSELIESLKGGVYL